MSVAEGPVSPAKKGKRIPESPGQPVLSLLCLERQPRTGYAGASSGQAALTQSLPSGPRRPRLQETVPPATQEKHRVKIPLRGTKAEAASSPSTPTGKVPPAQPHLPVSPRPHLHLLFQPEWRCPPHHPYSLHLRTLCPTSVALLCHGQSVLGPLPRAAEPQGSRLLGHSQAGPLPAPGKPSRTLTRPSFFLS